MPRLSYTTLPHPRLGCILLACSSKGLRHLWLGDSDSALIGELNALYADNRQQLHHDPQALADAGRAIIALADNPHTPITLPLDCPGSDFSRAVWQALRAIPVGTWLTYSQLAAQLGRPKAVRAVASACARNNLALIIPCHRVLGKDGGLRGYRWGVARKAQLLAQEAAAVTSPRDPSSGPAT